MGFDADPLAANYSADDQSRTPPPKRDLRATRKSAVETRFEAERELNDIEAELMNNIKSKAVKKVSKREKSSKKNRNRSELPEIMSPTRATLPPIN